MASLVIHGGAGTIPRADLTPDGYRAARDGLRDALRTGWEILRRAGWLSMQLRQR